MPLNAVLSTVPVVQCDLHQRVPEMLVIKQIVVLVPLAQEWQKQLGDEPLPYCPVPPTSEYKSQLELLLVPSSMAFSSQPLFLLVARYPWPSKPWCTAERLLLG